MFAVFDSREKHSALIQLKFGMKSTP